MTQKIIVADDSQTIQKVVAITLANDSFELISCTNENELTKKLAANDFSLVLLDFNLSDSKDGYQLASFVKKAAPAASIMAMMGTFDQIDEAKMKAAGIADYITKPFDSNIFIQKCRVLASGDEFADMDEEIDDDWSEDTKEDIRLDQMETSEEEDSEENWVVDSSQFSQEDESDDAEAVVAEESSNDQNELQDELMGWGIPVPTKIGAAAASTLMPPVIAGRSELEEGISVDLSEDQTSVENEDSLEEVTVEEGESLGVNPFETTLPESDDLEYPEMDDVGSSPDDLKDIKLSSHLVAVDELAPEQDSSPNLNLGPNENTEDDLASEIASEISPDDFWAADEVAPSSDDDHASVGGAIANPDIAQSVDDHAVSNETDALAPLHSNLSLEREVKKPAKKEDKAQSVAPVDEEKLVAKLKDTLAPMIEEMIKAQMETMMKERVDHIAWEVIPDLAENLIRDEIKNISTQL